LAAGSSPRAGERRRVLAVGMQAALGAAAGLAAGAGFAPGQLILVAAAGRWVAGPSPGPLWWPDVARAELGERAAAALAEEHFEPELAIRERAHQAEARSRWPRSFLTAEDPEMTGE
jgi:hypothetical protein